MARSKQAPVIPILDKPNPKVKPFVVLTDGVILRIAPGHKPQRILRGRTVTLHTDYTDVKKLIAMKAIAPARQGKSFPRTNAKTAALAAGAERDVTPTKPVDVDSLEANAVLGIENTPAQISETAKANASADAE